MALDHEGVVERLAVLDIVPTAEMWDFAEGHGREFGFTNPHWFFLSQKFDRPERLIGAAPHEYYFAEATERFDPEALADHRSAASRADTIHGICEDYRAGAGIDDELDREDRAAGRRIGCPTLVLWSGREELPRWFQPLELWRRWADRVSGQSVDSGHFLAEETPDVVAGLLVTFLSGAPDDRVGG